METLRDGLDFGQALFWIKGGFRVRRAAWRDGEYISIHETPYGRFLYVFSITYKPPVVYTDMYIPLHADLLAEDWQLLG